MLLLISIRRMCTSVCVCVSELSAHRLFRRDPGERLKTGSVIEGPGREEGSRQMGQCAGGGGVGGGVTWGHVGGTMCTGCWEEELGGRRGCSTDPHHQHHHLCWSYSRS